jgi:hypothetical protein
MDLYDHIVAKIADTLDFGFVSVQNTFEKSVIIENPSTKNIHFKIKALEIFNVNVKEGTIPRNSRFELKIKITPESAKVVISNMMIVLDDSHSKIIKISAIGKYPNLRISKNALDFGHVLIGNSKEMELVIQNTEKVLNLNNRFQQPS